MKLEAFGLQGAIQEVSMIKVRASKIMPSLSVRVNTSSTLPFVGVWRCQQFRLT